MSLPPFASKSPARRWPKIAAIVGLLLAGAVSLLLLFHSVELTRREAPRAPGAQEVRDAFIQALASRVDALEQQAETFRRAPEAPTPADLDDLRQTLDERLARIEAAPPAEAVAAGLDALRLRLGEIETRLESAPPPSSLPSPPPAPPPPAAAPPAAPKPVTEPSKPRTAKPPFSVLGVERRGGERFLAVAAPGARALSDVRLLREGDAAGAWRLQTIEAQAAVFRVDGRMLRVALP
ncbi:MAG: hypothetical protein LBS49_02790 [Candidatus Accumulibacter sp.]|jgi:hypothetical protein|nr:hypothetical protein [Accumulibacter sp.]